MRRRQIIRQQLADVAQKTAQAFSFRGALHTPPVVSDALADAWDAFDVRNYDRVEQLIGVARFLIARESAKFAADCERWLQRRLAFVVGHAVGAPTTATPSTVRFVTSVCSALRLAIRRRGRRG